MSEPLNRRPLGFRNAAWAHGLAAAIARTGVSPNTISALGLALSVLAAGLLLTTGITSGWMRAALLLLAAAGIVGRLVCNLIDGMMAVENNKAVATGPIWNEFPDRISDSLILIAAGYAAETSGQPAAAIAGWCAALMALLIAYTREMGRGLGFPADFSGPMAKPQRMAVIIAAAILAMAEIGERWQGAAFMIGLWVIVAAGLWTVARRLMRLARLLQDQKDKDETR